MARTKAQNAESIQSELNLTKNKSVQIIETLLEIMKKTLASDEDVLISGFGKFCVNGKRERRGQNPATGTEMMLLPRKVVTFNRLGKLRGKINK